MRTKQSLAADSDRIEIDDSRRVHILEELGKGALSTVYRAVLEQQHGVCREVALKLFHAIASDEVDHVADLLGQTAQRAAYVRHPNVVAVHELGFADSQPFFLEELVDGVSLAELMASYAARQRRLPPDVALFIAVETAGALDGARTASDHEGTRLDMLHLGLTPREVMLSWRGEVKVSDFEVTMARGATSSVRSLRAVAARASMMAPEVASGGAGDARSDVFSLGIIMRELLVGPRFPSTLTNAEAIRLAREGYVQPLTFQPHIGEYLAAIMSRALEVEPDDRYPNASALAFDLRRVALSMGVGDARLFLRRTLEREFGEDSEVTKERG
jgi:serine/threonine protein kinase